MKKLIFLLILLSTATFINAQVVYIATDSMRLASENPDVVSNHTYTGMSDSLDPKVVFWIHGIAGNFNSWGRVQLVTQDQTSTQVAGYPVRKVYGKTVVYTAYEKNDPLPDAAGRINQDMEFWRINNPRTDTLAVKHNFAIAHSQGGIVARAIRFKNHKDSVLYPEQFRHIATFGSPHKGAPIINSTSDTGLVMPWLMDGCTALGAAEINNFLDGSMWWRSAISASNVGSIARSACNAFQKTALPYLVNSIRKPIGVDYAQGAAFLNDSLAPFTLQDTINTKGVNFYGVEEEPVLWRVLHTMTYTTDSVNLGTPILRTNPFGFNDDGGFPQKINEKYNDYLTKESDYASQARSLRHNAFISFWSFTNTIAFSYLANQSEQKAIQYRNAYQWLGHSNMNWKRFIGARHDTSWIDGYHCQCAQMTVNGLMILDTIVASPGDCNPNGYSNCYISPRMRHQIIEEESDGVVPVSSQTGMPGVPEWHKVRMENTNHMQERNCFETMNKLNSLFNGEYGKYFQLDEK